MRVCLFPNFFYLTYFALYFPRRSFVFNSLVLVTLTFALLLYFFTLTINWLFCILYALICLCSNRNFVLFCFVDFNSFIVLIIQYVVAEIRS